MHRAKEKMRVYCMWVGRWEKGTEIQSEWIDHCCSGDEQRYIFVQGRRTNIYGGRDGGMERYRDSEHPPTFAAALTSAPFSSSNFITCWSSCSFLTQSSEMEFIQLGGSPTAAMSGVSPFCKDIHVLAITFSHRLISVEYG